MGVDLSDKTTRPCRDSVSEWFPASAKIQGNRSFFVPLFTACLYDKTF